MLNLRTALRAALAVVFLGGASTLAASDRVEPVLGDDNVFHQTWFLTSFLELREDLADATAQGKRFAIVWEQANCPYCRDMHQINLADRLVNEWIRDHFDVLQLNLFGSRQVTDFDGEVLTESALARKYRINFTPTIQFFPESLEAIGDDRGRDVEVFRMPGYFRPVHFITAFEFVRGGHYRDTDFQRYLGERLEQARIAGRSPQHPLE
jgi:thioredoxin-related protein